VSEERAAAGTRVLRLFANPLSAKVLRAHADGPIRPSALYRELSWFPQTTVRSCIASLRGAGALVKLRIDDSPHAVENQLTMAGEEMLLVADAIEAWLARAPGGPLPPDGNAAKVAIKALVEAWSTPVMQVLATGPHSLAELDKAVPGIGYPLLKRRLGEMRLSCQIELVEVDNGGNVSSRFAVTEWLRRSIGPLAAAARCEHRQMAETFEPIGVTEIETALMLAVPLASMSVDANGTCALRVENLGVTVSVVTGEVESCVSGASRGCASWALGTAQTWLDTLINGRHGTDIRLSKMAPRPAADLVDAVHGMLPN
jgi:DNA-binding HxlR family transcriptional regulator